MKWSSLALLAVLAVGAGLRFAGIGFGLPFELRPDEDVFRAAVTRMAETGDLNPHRFEHGGVLFHLLYGVTRAAHTVASAFDPQAAGTFQEFTRRRDVLVRIQRALSATLGVATVLLAWLAARRLESEAAGLVAAGLLAVLFLPVRDAHFGTIDVPAAFFSMAALVALLGAMRRGARGAFVLAGALAGVAAAARYFPVVLALPLCWAAWRADRAAGYRPLRALVGPRVLLAGGAMIAAAVLVSPYSVLAFDELRSGFVAAYFVGGRASFDPLARLRDVALAGMPDAADWPFAAVSAVAAVAALFGRDPGARAFALFVAAHAAALAAGTSFYLRWLNPVLPPLCVLAGVGLTRATRRWKGAAVWCALLAAAVAVAPAARSLGIVRLFVRETTFQQAERCLREQLPASAVAACPERGVARVLRRVIPLAPWDPHALASRPEWWAVVPRHPFADIGHDPGWISAILKGEPDVETIASFRAIDPDGWAALEFEPSDHFFFPLRGFWRVDRGGPDFEILRVRPRPRAAAPPGPPPPVLGVKVSESSLRVEFSAPFGVDLRGYYVRFATEQAASAGDYQGPFAWGRDPIDLPMTPAIRGRYVVQAATVGASGLGPWSEPFLVVTE